MDIDIDIERLGAIASLFFWVELFGCPGQQLPMGALLLRLAASCYCTPMNTVRDRGWASVGIHLSIL